MRCRGTGARRRRLALAATTAACGDDDDDDAASDTLSRTELIAAGDAICAATSKKNQPLEEATFTDDALPPLARWGEFWPKLAGNEQAAVEQMRQLRPSADDEADFTAAVDAYAELIPLFRAAGERAAAGDPPGHDAAMADIEQASQPVQAGFDKLGFEECGSDEDE